MTEIVSEIISAVALIVCGLLTYLSNKTAKTQQKQIADIERLRREEEKRMEERSKKRAEEGKLQLKMLHANSKLTIGVAMALKHGHCNGEVEEGLAAVKAADEEYTRFLEEATIELIRK